MKLVSLVENCDKKFKGHCRNKVVKYFTKPFVSLVPMHSADQKNNVSNGYNIVLQQVKSRRES